MTTDICGRIRQGDFKAIARGITIVENRLEGYQHIMAQLSQYKAAPIIGITGPPGAGKSTMVDALIQYLTQRDYKVAVVAVDPASPFNFGSILGDRIRMQQHYLNPKVYIRSLSTRGQLGGLNAGAFEVSELLSRATFNYIIIETVGVGQSELDIAGLADCTILTLVPESGDDIQAIKSGIMEIADLYVINKSDRDGADILLSRLKALLMHDARKDNIVKTVASSQIGIEDVFNAVHKVLASGTINQERKTWMFANRLWQQIAAHRLKDISLQDLQTAIKSAIDNHSFNYYTLLKQYTEG